MKNIFNKLKTYLISLSIMLVLIASVWFYVDSLTKNLNKIKPDNTFAFSLNLPKLYSDPLLIKLFGTEFSIAPLGASPAEAATDKNIVKYIDAFLNTDIVQTKYFNKIKEDIILKSPGHPEMFNYKIDLSAYDFIKNESGDFVFYEKGYNGDDFYKRFIIPAPFLIDADGKKSLTIEVETTLSADGQLTLKPSQDWLAKAKYPVILDPTIEISIINVHSHPKQGDNWTVDFTAMGRADLKIIPNDRATIDDDEFVSLSCGDEKREPQILADDVIFYPNWECSGIGRVIHYTKKAGNHTLRFEFSDQISFAYNSSLSDKFKDSSLVGYWSFNGADMGTTSAIDLSGNVNTGWFSGNVKKVPGINGQGLSFDGDGDYIRVSDTPTLSFPSNIFSISFWMNTPNVVSQQGIIGKAQSSGTLEYAIYILDNELCFQVWDGTDPSKSLKRCTMSLASYNITANTWIHFVMVSSGSSSANNLASFKNGAKMYNGTFATSIPYNGMSDLSSSFTIGETIGVMDQTFNGTIDDVRVYNRALSASEISEQYRAGAARMKINTPPPSVANTSSSLVGYWSFDGDDMNWASTTAEVLDLSGNNNNGDVVGFDNKSAVPGISGQGLSFDGVGDYVDLGNNSSFSLSNTNYTLSAWVKGNDLSTRQSITRRYGKFSLDVGGETVRKPSVYLWSAASWFSANTELDYDTWYHISVTYDHINVVIYINGVEDASYSETSTNTDPGYKTVISGAGGVDDITDLYFWNGSIDDVRIYNRALSADEISEQYRAGAARMKINTPPPSVANTSSSLVGYWSFDGPAMNWASTTAEALDLSGNNNNGNIVGFDNKSAVPGISGQGLSFDGVADYITTNANYLIDSSAGAVSLWLKVDKFPVANTMYFTAYDNSYTYSRLKMAIDSTGKFDTNLGWGADYPYLVNKGQVVVGDWTHVVFTWDGTTGGDVYQDGEWLAFDGGSGGVEIYNYVIIGANLDTGDPDSYFNGLIDDVRIYNRALSAAEITQLYQFGARRLKN